MVGGAMFYYENYVGVPEIFGCDICVALKEHHWIVAQSLSQTYPLVQWCLVSARPSIQAHWDTPTESTWESVEIQTGLIHILIKTKYLAK